MLLTHRFPVFFLAAALCIIGAAVLIVRLPEFSLRSEALSMAVTADLTVLIPLLFYGLVVRKYRLSAITVIPVFILCLAIAGFILPEGHRGYVSRMEQCAILAELAMAGYGLIRLRTIVRTYRASAQTGFTERLQQSFEAVMGQNRAAAILTSEVAMCYYAFAGWTKKTEQEDFQQSFSYHKNTGYGGIVVALTAVVLIETVVIHLLLSPWNEAAAWIASISSVYAVVFLAADYCAALKRPVLTDDQFLYLRTGLRWRAQIPLPEIAKAEKVDYRETWDRDSLKMVLIGEPDLVIHFKNPVQVTGMYGMRRSVVKVGINADEKDVLLKKLAISAQ